MQLVDYSDSYDETEINQISDTKKKYLENPANPKPNLALSFKILPKPKNPALKKTNFKTSSKILKKNLAKPTSKNLNETKMPSLRPYRYEKLTESQKMASFILKDAENDEIAPDCAKTVFSNRHKYENDQVCHQNFSITPFPLFTPPDKNVEKELRSGRLATKIFAIDGASLLIKDACVPSELIDETDPNLVVFAHAARARLAQDMTTALWGAANSGAPCGVSRRKHQITALAAEAREQELAAQAAKLKLSQTRRETRAKYGW